MKNILITGGCGFIGSNLTVRLTEKKNKIRLLDNFSSNSRYSKSKYCEVIKGDICDKKTALKACKGMDVVIHLAASGSVIDSVADPLKNFQVNSAGTLNMLKSAVDMNVKKFIFASTGGALIGDAELPVTEISLPKPISPYGASKLCGEGYCNAFSKSYGIKTICLRFGNVYGPCSDNKKGVITNFIKSIIKKEPMKVYGDGKSSRDFLFVDDICQGIISAISKKWPSPCVLHLGSGVETTISDLAKLIIKTAGLDNYNIKHFPIRKGEVVRNFSSYSKARKILNFTPKFTLDKGIKSTYLWFKENI
jgi:UDP-glucose 4-epimerase